MTLEGIYFGEWILAEFNELGFRRPLNFTLIASGVALLLMD